MMQTTYLTEDPLGPSGNESNSKLGTIPQYVNGIVRTQQESASTKDYRRPRPEDSPFDEMQFWHVASPRPAYYWFSEATVIPSLSDVLQALYAASVNSIETSIKESEASVKQLLNGVYVLDESGLSRSAAQEVMYFVEQRLRQNALSDANRVLEMADVSKMSSRSLLGLVRSTSRVRDFLPAWNRAYADSRNRVAQVGKNPDALFVGLPKPDAVA